MNRTSGQAVVPSGAELPPRIRLLDPAVVTQIAAGEVIERPASVVKELVENALDAGARRVDLDLETGGLELIRVVDDGCGIHPDDVPLAFHSHTTSKLRNASDLFRIHTLGFRGEALAAIGSVAHVVLQSRPAALDQGAEIVCEGGRLSAPRPWNGAAGTRVEVRRLFFNTPVRRRFLRSPATEMGHVLETVTRLALAYEGLHLALTHNGRPLLSVPAAATVRERVSLFFGSELAAALVAVQGRYRRISLDGFVAEPAYDRPHPRMQYFFVNGRYVRDRALTHALQEAYRGLIMTGRYPAAFLFLHMPPEEVDVNVHPSKVEVRFRDAQAVYRLVLASVREGLRETARPAAPLGAVGPGIQVPPGSATGRAEGSVETWTRLPTGYDRQELGQTAASATASVSSAEAPVPPASGDTASPSPARNTSPSQRPLLQPPPGLKAMQLHNAYLVAETPEGMLVIDQHALHERILYEEWKSKLRDGKLPVQKLLVPEPVDLSAAQAALILGYRQALHQVGLFVEEFGGATVLVTAYPALAARVRPAELLLAALDHLQSAAGTLTEEQLLDRLLKVFACRAAVKAGDPLAPEEIEALLAQRHLVHDAHHCPHGRPTALFFSKQELDRQFRRT